MQLATSNWLLATGYWQDIDLMGGNGWGKMSIKRSSYLVIGLQRKLTII